MKTIFYTLYLMYLIIINNGKVRMNAAINVIINLFNK